MGEGWIKIRERVGYNINLVTFILAFFEIVFLIIVLVVFLDIMREPEIDHKVKVDNINSIEGIPEVIADKVGVTLYNAMSVNLDANQNIRVSGAVIRDGTLLEKHFDESQIGTDGVNIASFIVDVPSARQSYWMWYSWLDGYGGEEDDDWKMESVVACPMGEEAIYMDFACKDLLNEPVRNQIVTEYLKCLYSEDFYAYMDLDDLDMKRIKIIASKSEFSQEEEQKYLNETRKFVRSLGVSPDLFEYSVESAPIEELNEPVYDY